MREDRAADFFAPAFLSEPCYADKRVAFGRAVFQIGVTLVIHVVQQSYRFPKIGILAAQVRKMFHRICNGVAMFPQAFGLDPVVQNIQRLGGERLIHHPI